MSRNVTHKGARWFRCDFQVHTPRDRNWKGKRPATEEERQAWATALVKAARVAQLDAIAVTDHHDLVMFPYVKAAAATEVNGEGTRIPTAERLVVFPGIELTLSVPCQALLLFDADIPLDQLDQLPGALGYEQAPATDQRTAQTEPLKIKELNGVLERLDERPSLKGRYILLPHVSDGGHKTILRSGFAQHYKTFRGCGGYTDGALPDPGSGNDKILNGLDGNYGYKPLAVFQTSDSRRSDFRELGKHSTWVKWSEPTAEALRQSCLARSSRISQTAPDLPSIRVTRVEVSASKFLGKQNIFLSPQYTAIIGGRGTGKSTLLEYAKWALCSQVAQREAGTLDHEQRSRSLIEHTLAEVKGTVRVEVDVHGVPHVVVRRTSGDAPITIQVDGGDPRASDEDEVRRLLPVEAYSQKQLSALGGTTEDVLAFLLAPVANDVSTIADRLQSAADDLREAFARMRTQKRALRERTQLTKERESLNKQRASLEKEFSKLDPADAAILRMADGLALERQLSETWARELSASREGIARLLRELEGWPSPPPTEPTPNAQALQAMFAALSKLRKAVGNHLTAAMDVFDNHVSLKAYGSEAEALETRLKDARQRFKEARERAKAHESAIAKTVELSERIQTIDARVAELGNVEDEFEEAVQEYSSRTERWLALVRERSVLVEERCEGIEADSRTMIRGTARPGANLTRPIELLAQVAKGSRVRSEKFERLSSHVREQPSPLTTWMDVLDELRLLLEVQDEDASLPPAVHLHAAGFTDKDLRAIAKQLDDESWLRLRLAAPGDAVTFDYKSRMGEYIPFTQASAGQRATALMRVLLATEGAPLLVDQPEDDLDNRVIQEIAEEIAEAKVRRQLIFASHNANLVVNGDADLVVVFDYEVAGEQTSGVVKALGAIDSQPVRDSIAEVMEGGPEAFRLRRDKYGY